jgi:hypothetical protein
LLLLLRGGWMALRAPVIRLRHYVRVLRLRHSGVDRPRRWRGRLRMVIAGWTVALLALILVAWLARAVFVVFALRKPWDVLPNADTACRSVSVSCGAITGWFTSVLSIALASIVFLFWRFWRVQRRYLRKARKHPRDLVPTAGAIFGDIVGRDDLCRVVMEDLRTRGSGRPHVLVGGVGTGKTAVLIRLTELLARHKAIPVPIRLRDASPLDFAGLAKKRFVQTVNSQLVSEAEGEKIWRRLLQERRIVVLADGLDEAMCGAADTDERDSKIRLAIREAYDQRLPLLIASRPHAPLRDMDATIYELEPLSEDAALLSVEEGGLTDDDKRLSWIVETAAVADAPLYLQITRQIYRLDMLDQIATRQAEVLGVAGHDPSRLRLRLLQTWEKAIVSGDLYPEVPLRPEERQVTLDWLSALACVGLRDDSLDVRLDSVRSEVILSKVRQCREAIDDKTGRKLRLTGIDLPLAATWGARLGLVELLAGGVRFQHSLIQAYLGSRMMDAALRDPAYMQAALSGQAAEAAGTAAQAVPSDLGKQDPGPGREFLIALVLHSRRAVLEWETAGQPLPQPSQGRPEAVSSKLAEAAADRCDNKALDIYAAALEISSVAPGDRGTGAGTGQGTRAGLSHLDITRKVLAEWPRMRAGDPQTLEEGKLGLVRRFGESLRTLAESRYEWPDGLGYAQLYLICCTESTYRIRLAAAQEIGRGGILAYQEVRPELALPGEGCDACREEREAQAAPAAGQPRDDAPQWAQQVSAWLAPLLIISIDADAAGHDQIRLYESAKSDLGQWLRHLHPDRAHEVRLTISEEIALAQGFKYAANRRYGHVHARPAALGYLEEEALDMLKHARYWFSQLTLIQALCLWAIQGNQSPAAGEHPNPDAVVDHWLSAIGADVAPGAAQGRVHPFVEAAAVLAARALETGRPERFIWMDESDLVSRVGSGRETVTVPGPRHDRWILPSMGWSGLDSRAQQLVADVLLLLNLAERGEQPGRIEQWLHRADKDTVPPCIKRDRRPLQPGRTVGTAEGNPPGSSCADGCPFDLCPYPPRGMQGHRAELSEAFCRHQYMLVSRVRFGRRTARWQGLRAGQMRMFWSAMAERARIGPAGR